MTKMEKRLIDLAMGLDNSCKFDKKAYHFTFICSGPRVLAIGQNFLRKTSPLSIHHKFQAIHSEVDAYLKVRHYDLNWRKVDIYNVRLSRTNKEIGMSRPCPCCTNFFLSLGVRGVNYTDSDGKFQYSNLTKYPSNIIIESTQI